MNTTQFYGVHTALVTPMLDNGSVAYDELAALVEKQVAEGINGLVAVGTTGESPTLDHDEHSQVIRTVAEAAGGKVPVLAGTGSNSTAEAVSLTKRADADEGVTGMLVVAPYYNKPGAEGQFRHFSAIAESTEKPIILYSIPSRCGVDIPVEVCARLFEKYPHVCGIKEAGGQSARVAQLVQKLGSDYLILSGDDGLTLPFMSFGAKGVISVASNLIVTDLVEMVQLALKNDFIAADKINRRYQPLFSDLFIQPNPVPVKTAMQRAGIISSAAVRLPMCEMTNATLNQLIKTLEGLGL
ncbi:4-hydroxy-tetrahydrodipicolinate synthase [Cerasicoccus arenae]|uniref:4-hydroxy-tetrahydrodipicolinate synthase n=1 Tax=Cerasicoccus arenae TaxID=424488 RepID=A0A8J3GD65_9BACT|nr:4-hydroxy-tetrahydrodipicolinate synthase [Cerasicoccus arenae]MBK1856692.1 4-hydroxy-tetrahydrodipicolinate synthase [Cerasicoccus arenae]GHB98945.1 4-hydroxy-tetrahydrodipicolinate synthase [Cerasicoccus arenae]